MTSPPPVLRRLTEGLRGDGLDRYVAMRPGQGARPAAVLAVLACAPDARSADEVGLTFVERSAGLRKHAGQIAFPGGAADDGDADLVQTALREAGEEIGLAGPGVTVLGRLPAAHVAVSRFDVTTVVAWAPAPLRVAVVDPAEVAAVFTVSVADLVDPGHRVLSRHPTGYRGPAFEVAGVFLWGLTAHLTDALLTLGGWSVPWDQTRERDVPRRFLTDQWRGVAPGPAAH